MFKISKLALHVVSGKHVKHESDCQGGKESTSVYTPDSRPRVRLGTHWGFQLEPQLITLPPSLIQVMIFAECHCVLGTIQKPYME